MCIVLAIFIIIIITSVQYLVLLWLRRVSIALFLFPFLDEYKKCIPLGISAETDTKQALDSLKMGGRHNAAAEPKADQDLEALKQAKIPLAFRDKCGHLLVDLNKCRRANYYQMNKCGHERHTYEECEYYAWMDRVAKKKVAEQQYDGTIAVVNN